MSQDVAGDRAKAPGDSVIQNILLMARPASVVNNYSGRSVSVGGVGKLWGAGALAAGRTSHCE